jgi:hypothetical protein
MRRKRKSYLHAIKQKKIDKQFTHRDFPLGYYRKRNALDCGRSRCYICSSQKLLDIPKISDIKSDVDFEEQLDEISTVVKTPEDDSREKS